MKLRLYQVDSFTTQLFCGNPAGVVANAEKIDEATMQKIARELNLSETAFIINESTDDYDIEVRFFTPTKEVPICGHATIAAHYVYAKENNIGSGILRQKTKAGILPVEIVTEKNDIKIIMTQSTVEFGDIIEDRNKELLLQGLGIRKNELLENLPIQIVSTGHSKVMVPIINKDTLDKLAPKNDVLSLLSKEIDCNGYYAFTFDSEEEGVLTSGRMFAPAIGINEDPVTGNANGPMGAYLTKYGKIEASTDGMRFKIKQGEAIDRKGYMEVEVYSKEKDPKLVKIIGRAVIAFKTELILE